MTHPHRHNDNWSGRDDSGMTSMPTITMTMTMTVATSTAFPDQTSGQAQQCEHTCQKEDSFHISVWIVSEMTVGGPPVFHHGV